MTYLINSLNAHMNKKQAIILYIFAGPAKIWTFETDRNDTFLHRILIKIILQS
jgi:hypothetical protein